MRTMIPTLCEDVVKQAFLHTERWKDSQIYFFLSSILSVSLAGKGCWPRGVSDHRSSVDLHCSLHNIQVLKHDRQDQCIPNI